VPLRSRLGPAWVRTERWDCTPMTRFPMSRCTQPVEQQPTKRIVLVGDSHLQQLAGALIPTARSHGWQLIAIVRGGLPVLHGVRGEPGRAGLPGLKQRRHRRDRRPAAGRGGHAGQPGVRLGLTEQTPPGSSSSDAISRRWASRCWPCGTTRGSTPRCRTACRTSASAAVAPRAELYPADPPWTRIPDLPSNVAFLDIADAVCTPAFCRPRSATCWSTSTTTTSGRRTARRCRAVGGRHRRRAGRALIGSMGQRLHQPGPMGHRSKI
jgi:hypothetical protein